MSGAQPFVCRRCRAELGQTDGVRLCLGAVWLETTIKVGCAACGMQRRWLPVSKKPATVVASRALVMA